ncbi:unnamed protein product, partial [marine sediment metagenome]
QEIYNLVDRPEQWASIQSYGDIYASENYDKFRKVFDAFQSSWKPYMNEQKKKLMFVNSACLFKYGKELESHQDVHNLQVKVEQILEVLNEQKSEKQRYVKKENYFRKEGNSWIIYYKDVLYLCPKLIGVKYLYQLIQKQGIKLSGLELSKLVDSSQSNASDSGPYNKDEGFTATRGIEYNKEECDISDEAHEGLKLTDQQTIRDIKKRLKKIEDEIEDAKYLEHIEKVELLLEEKEKLIKYVTQTTG